MQKTCAFLNLREDGNLKRLVRPLDEDEISWRSWRSGVESGGENARFRWAFEGFGRISG